MIRSYLFSVGFLVACFVPTASAQSTERVNVSSAGAGADGFTRYPSITPDGRYVAFASAGANLVEGDNNGVLDVFVHDLFTSGTIRVSVSSSGLEGAGVSLNGPQALSSDGRYVAFQSAARNLVQGDTNGHFDVFVRDLQSGVTLRIDLSSSGVQANEDSLYPAISADGRYVAFYSDADNLVPTDLNGADDVFVHDLQTGQTTLVSVDSNGLQGNADSYAPSLSADGRYVAFYSEANNLASGDANQADDVYVHDTLTGSTVLVSVGLGGQAGNGFSQWPMISADGQQVAFVSTSSDLVPSDLNLLGDVFVRDLASGTTSLASVSSSGDQGDQASSFYAPSISGSGRYVAFNTNVYTLVPPEQNNFEDVFLRDLQAGLTTRESVNSANQQANNDSYTTAISGDGRFVVFKSTATNLVTGDTNGFGDIFVHDRGSAQAASFCAADIHGSTCPCANAGDAGRGCQNSEGTGGASITDFGTASLSNDTLVLVAHGMLAQSRSLLLQGATETASRRFGDGLLCLGGGLKRLFAKTATAGGAAASPVAGDLSISARSAALGDPIPAGATRFYQIYYRDAVAGFCSPPTGDAWNASSGRAVSWAP